MFDLFAIATGLEFWKILLDMMFDTSSSYWNICWSFFIILGGFVFCWSVLTSNMSQSVGNKGFLLVICWSICWLFVGRFQNIGDIEC